MAPPAGAVTALGREALVAQVSPCAKVCGTATSAVQINATATRAPIAGSSFLGTQLSPWLLQLRRLLVDAHLLDGIHAELQLSLLLTLSSRFPLFHCFLRCCLTT